MSAAASMLERPSTLSAYPNLSAAAAMLGVAVSTLSRRDDLQAQARGERDRVLEPSEVMRLAYVFRKRSVNEVAGELIAYAQAHEPALVAEVEADVEQFFIDRANEDDRHDDREAFLAAAKRMLPSKLYNQVERTVEAGGTQAPVSIVGNTPKKPSARRRRSARTAGGAR
jgi:hypothetical protein